MKRRVITGALVAALAALVAAPAAFAVTSSVRIEGSNYQVLPRSVVDEGKAGGIYADTEGTSFTTESATALGATALALRASGLPWDMTVGSYGPFINSFNGLGMDPTTYANWWNLVVNGFNAPVGCSSLTTTAGDSYLWFQNPDASYPSKPSKLLVVKPSGGTAKGGFVTGKTVTVATLADDLAKVNSAADAARFGSTAIETPKQFQPIAGTTLHVGEKVYSEAEASSQLKNLTPGTYAVWAEKAMDDTGVYARSETVLINIDSAPSLGALTASSRGSQVVVRCALSKKSTVRIVLTRGSKRVGTLTATKAAGTQTFTVRLTSRVPTNATIKATVTAQDDWGRSVSKSITLKKR